MWGALPKISSGARAPVEPLVNGAPVYYDLCCCFFGTSTSAKSRNLSLDLKHWLQFLAANFNEFLK